MNTEKQAIWPRPLTAEEIDWLFDFVRQEFDTNPPVQGRQELVIVKKLFEFFRASIHAGLDTEAFRTAYNQSLYVMDVGSATQHYSEIRAAALDPTEENFETLLAGGERPLTHRLQCTGKPMRHDTPKANEPRPCRTAPRSRGDRTPARRHRHRRRNRSWA